MSKINYPVQIPVAKSALNHHLIAVEHLFQQLKSRFVNRKNSNSLSGVLSTPGDVSPLITNIAFSFELALKILRIQDDPDHAPRGHDLFNLYKPLSSDIKTTAEDKYIELLANWDKSDPMKYVAFAPNYIKEPKNAPTLNKALKNIKDAFVEWRYLYENMGTQKKLVFNFVEANCALKSLMHASAEFRGGIIIEHKWSSET